MISIEDRCKQLNESWFQKETKIEKGVIYPTKLCLALSLPNDVVIKRENFETDTSGHALYLASVLCLESYNEGVKQGTLNEKDRLKEKLGL